MKVLLGYQPDLEAVDEEGRTALSLAAQYNRDELLKVLADRNAELEVVDEEQVTPL